MPRNHPAAVLALAFCAMNPLPGAAAARALEPDSIKTITVEDTKRLSQDTRGRLLLDGKRVPQFHSPFLDLRINRKVEA